MMRSTAKSFYQRYFSATQEASWLARLMAGLFLDNDYEEEEESDE